MVTVVNPVPHSSVVKETHCRNCGVTLSYVPSDIITEVRHGYGGGPDLYNYIQCPGCGKKTEVRNR